MALIQIDLSEIEKMKTEIHELKYREKVLENKIMTFDEKYINERIKRDSFQLFSSYLRKMFLHIGFSDTDAPIVVSPILGYMSLDEALDSNQLDFELCAEVTEKFREAYVRIGIKPEIMK